MDEQTKAEIEAMITERLLRFYDALVQRGQISPTEDPQFGEQAAAATDEQPPAKH